jgi:hypothetical protein
MAIKASLGRARGAVFAVVAVAIAVIGAIGSILGYWDLAISVRDKAPMIGAGLAWLATPPGAVALVFCFLTALVWAYFLAAKPGGRASARRLEVFVAYAIDNIMNSEPHLRSDELFIMLRRWEEDAMVAMEEEGCSEVEISSVRTLGMVEAIKVRADDLGDADCALFQRIAYTKAMRVRDAARRLEGL